MSDIRNIHLEYFECPCCGQETLYASELDRDDGLPNGIIECRSCGNTFQAVVDLLAEEEEAEQEQHRIEAIEADERGELDDEGYEPNGGELVYCERCHGTGGEPLDDGISLCEACDGTGYKWEYL